MASEDSLVEDEPSGGEPESPTIRKKYQIIIERIFSNHYTPGLGEFDFLRNEIESAAVSLGVSRPKNLGDVIYSFRFRRDLPTAIQETAPVGLPWVIRLAGIGRYRFQTNALANISPTPGLVQTKVPDATPQVIFTYKLTDEQALLARVRCNRLIDLFTGVTCYSLQSHLRTQVKNVGQIETDELYAGIDKRGVQYVLPVQAKAGKDRLSVVQIEQRKSRSWSHSSVA